MKEGHKNIAKAFSTRGRGTHLKRGYDLRAALKTPLFTPVLPFTRPPVESQHVRSQNPHLKEKCEISPKENIFFIENRPMTIFSSRSSYLTAIDFRQRD